MVSVIIRNKNESEYIGFTIQSIIDFLPGAEIIILDNNSTDDSLEIVKLFSNQIDITIKKIDDYTPGKAINKGVNIAKNEIILILSAHSQITNLDLNLVKENLEEYVAIFGKQIPIYKGKKITPRYIWSHFGDKRVRNMFSRIENRYFLHNAFCFYKKPLLQEYPFDESLPGKEDRYWVIDMIEEKGFGCLYNPLLIVNHYYTKNGATWKGIG